MKLTRDQQSLEAITDLIEYAFMKQQPILNDPLFLSRYAHADAYGMYQGETLTNLVMANHFEMQLFQKRVKMAGVGYVASYPECRGKGGISSIMAELLIDLHAQDVVVSQLAPFSENFYRQFGYEPTSRRKIYRIPAAAFNNFTSERRGEIKRGSWQQLKPTIKKIYQKLLNQQVGTVVREDWWWERLDEYYPHRFYAVAFDETGIAKGYIIYRMQGKSLLIDELAYQDDFSLRKLLTYMKAHVSSFEEFVYHGPVHALIENYFHEQGQLSITLEPYMMSRIIDIEQLLSTIPIYQDGVVIEVTEDKECPWNVGSWQISQGTCKKVEQSGDLKATIHGWSELLLGELTLEEGIFLGKVIAEKDFESDPFPKGRQSFYDYF